MFETNFFLFIAHSCSLFCRRFALNMLLRTLVLALLIDFTGNGYLSAFGQPSGFYTEPFWPNQCFLAWIALTHVGLHLDMSYSLSAAVLTLMGVYSPRDWPPLFGPVAGSWTVRRFWGYGCFVYLCPFLNFLGLMGHT